ncbi:MAG: hypothetical protein VX770_06810 [Candidatus Neomarinimicrobiota bacterium]|jgi:hypothetical protein|nr:hypothetical protein [Candidatus Neomarinimicrobiota bacterium]|tara:strand:+ start:483 stop:701 length:219 start_codon:yes stop_codon:yes gene_type:complete
MTNKSTKTTNLNITDIDWSYTDDSEEELPEELNLKWGSKKWNKNQVKKWLINHFKTDIFDFKIQEFKKNDSG